MPNIQSLHNHTTASDGKQTHREALASARRYGYSAIAFADHDNVIGEKVITDLRRNPVDGINWISGIEISSALPRELGGVPFSGFHIVGLFINPAYTPLLEHCLKSQAARKERMRKMVINLKRVGFTISEEDCLRESGGEVVARPHIAAALNAHPENVTIMENLRAQMERDSARNPQLRLQYDNMMDVGASQYPFALLLAPNAYVKDVYVDYLYSIDMDDTVSLIRGAGGVAVVAHYSTAKCKIPPELLEQFIKEKRIDGVETVYGLRGFGTRSGEHVLEDRAFLRDMVAKYGCAESGGADAHFEEELRDFARISDLGGKTVGLAERMIGQYNLKYGI